MVTPLAVVVVLIVGLVSWTLYQNNYDIREEKVMITGGSVPLPGVLALPEQGDGPFGLVVFVHGDGPIDATHETFYRPLWESFAKAGYASLSWDKPGVNGAPGNWLDQSMDDRAAETEAAIEWARGRSDIDPSRIGLWGASQAGWVMPKVVNLDPDVAFVIAVGTAINWLEQGEFNTIAELSERNASTDEFEKARVDRAKNLEQLARDASFGDLVASGEATDGLTEDRWNFIRKNYRSDARADLETVEVPVLLMLGVHDVNVDIADTERVYRELLDSPGQLVVKKYSDGTHSLVKKNLEDSELMSTLVAILAPRSLFVPGYLADQTAFLEGIHG
ncbi:S9 family peptidase [Rhodococcus sp. ARC_M6]|uniref:alpha/beta hydrolase family protein n=1 Tax=Rhodococcus sp. ARC_M6 TaxID=2928852 RepID=UPI001FB3F735|nr:alpha/beta hydrolase [Rhodococcus sp. ARC_M6]MCJ0904495.1 alpha/beta hydrolase [Rhodococcus sp. ARC_M6]